MTDVVYAITHKRKLLYIGRTNNFRRRQTEHLRNIYAGKGARRFRKAFRKVTFSDLDFTIVFDGSRKEVRKKERELIVKHRPPANTEFLNDVHEKKKHWHSFKKNSLQKLNSRHRRNHRHGYHLRKWLSRVIRTPCFFAAYWIASCKFGLLHSMSRASPPAVRIDLGSFWCRFRYISRR